MEMIEKDKNKEITFFTFSIIITLFLAGLTYLFDFGGSILGALFGGMIIRQTLIKGDKLELKEERKLTSTIEITTFGFFVYFFLFWIGLNADYYALYKNAFLPISIIILTFIGKSLGALIGAILSGLKDKEKFLIAIGMNTKGEVDIMIPTLMFSIGILDKYLFSSLVFMSITLTLFSSIIFRYLLKRYHYI